MTFFINPCIMFLKFLITAFCILTAGRNIAQTIPPPAQYPSPMQESVRRHERVVFDNRQGTIIKLNQVLPKPVFIYLPHKMQKAAKADLLIHFHGTDVVVADAAEKYRKNLVAVSVNLGTGSAAYAR